MTTTSPGETGRSEPAISLLAARGGRSAAGVVSLDDGNGHGTLLESIRVLALDDTLSLVQRSLDFDVDDVEGVIAGWIACTPRPTR